MTAHQMRIHLRLWGWRRSAAPEKRSRRKDGPPVETWTRGRNTIVHIFKTKLVFEGEHYFWQDARDFDMYRRLLLGKGTYE